MSGGDSNQPSFSPNDPDYGEQWGSRAIDAENAWEHVPQNHDVILAIVDTGVDISHEDLAGNYDPSIDRDFVRNDNNADDDMGMGTFMAGIAAAVTNNGTGMAGLAPVKIMGVKVLNRLGLGTYRTIADGIIYAAYNDADVITLSVGSYEHSAVLSDACGKARTFNDVVVVAGAGLDNTDQDYYPAAFSSVIGVAALATPDQRMANSNFGENNVEISAPGANIYSTFPDHRTLWNLRGIFPYDYGSMDGTSFAAAQVAGVAAGFRAYDETLSAGKIKQLLNEWADDLGDPLYYGSGRLDYFPPDEPRISSFYDVIEESRTFTAHDPCSESFLRFLLYKSVEVEVFDESKTGIFSYTCYLEDGSTDMSFEPLPSGTYYYRLRAGEKVSELRMVTLREKDSKSQ